MRHVQTDNLTSGLTINGSATAGQVLTATSDSTASWQVGGGGGGSYVDTTSTQSVGGIKTFSNALFIAAALTGGTQFTVRDTNASSSGSGGIASIGLTTTPTASGHRLGAEFFSANLANTAGIAGFTSEPWTLGSAQGTELRLYTTANTTASRLVALTIGNDKSALFVGKVTVPSLQINTTSAPIVGYVWTATDTIGNGSWQVSGSGGADATTSSKGIVQLAGDLGGTAASPTTPTAVHITGTESIAGVKTFSNSMYLQSALTSGTQLTVQDTNTPSTGTAGVITAGTTAVPTASGQRLGMYLFSGSTSNTAGMLGYATETWGSGLGTQLRFQVTANTTGSRVTALTIDQDKTAILAGNIVPTTTGTLSVGTAALPFGNAYINALQIVPSAGSGKVLTSDVSGNATWQTSAAGITRNISSISSPVTAGATANTDYVYLVSGTTTLTLPTAVGNTNTYSVANTGVSTVTVATTSSQTINGSSTATLPTSNMSLDFISDNANWHVI